MFREFVLCAVLCSIPLCVFLILQRYMEKHLCNTHTPVSINVDDLIFGEKHSFSVENYRCKRSTKLLLILRLSQFYTLFNWPPIPLCLFIYMPFEITFINYMTK